MFHPKNIGYWAILYSRCFLTVMTIGLSILGAGFFQFFGKPDSLTTSPMNLGFFSLCWIIDIALIVVMVLETISLRHLYHGDTMSRKVLCRSRLKDLTFYVDLIAVCLPIDIIFAAQGVRNCYMNFPQ